MISRLAAESFRLYDRLFLEIGPGLSVFFGPNGSGKTTILEAIHLLGTLRSFRSARAKDLQKTGAASTRVEGTAEGERLRIEWVGTRRTLRRNDRAPEDLAAFCRDVRVVALAPEHQELVSGGAEERRRFLDRILFGLDRAYLDVARAYRRTLAHKQALLRQGLPFPVYLDRVAPWNEELAGTGERIRSQRREAAERLHPFFRTEHAALSGGPTKVHFEYGSSTRALRDELSNSARAEFAAQRALVGPHRDTVQILFCGDPVEQVASQGERATLLLALKLSELALLEEGEGPRPLILLDDPGTTLDRDRRRRLFDALEGRKNQVLLTTSDDQILAAALDRKATAFHKNIKEFTPGFSVAEWKPA